MIILLVAAFLSFQFFQESGSEKKSYKVGDSIATFTFDAIDSSLHHTNSQSVVIPSNQYIFINFWASWCESCARERPNVTELSKRLERKLFILRMASFDTLDKVFESGKLNGLVGVAALDNNDLFAKLFNVQELPQSILIDPKGKILKKFIGPIQYNQIEEIQQLVR